MSTTSWAEGNVQGLGRHRTGVSDLLYLLVWSALACISACRAYQLAGPFAALFGFCMALHLLYVIQLACEDCVLVYMGALGYPDGRCLPRAATF